MVVTADGDHRLVRRKGTKTSDLKVTNIVYLFGIITSQATDDKSSGVPVVMLEVRGAVYWWEFEDTASSQSSILFLSHSMKMTILVPENEKDVSVYYS